MKTYEITSKISIIVPDQYQATYDSNADFDQIVLRVRNDQKFVNFRVTDLGNTVTMEVFEGTHKFYEIRLRNDIIHEKAFQTVMAVHLA